MANIGGLGGLGGYDIGDILGAVGQSLLTSPRTAPLAGLPAAIQARNKENDQEMALTKLGIDPATAKVMSRNPQAAALWVTGDNAAKGRAMGAEAMKGFGAYTLPGEEPTAPAPASPSPAAPAQKVGSLGGLGGMQPAAGGAGGPYAGAVSKIESGARYDALGPVTKTGDRAYGKYQVMGANIPSWTQEVLGRSLTPQEFLNSQEAQDAVFEHKFGQYAAKYGPEGAARAWFAGEGGMNDLGRRDQLGTSVGDYSKRFMAGLGGAGGQPAPPAAASPAAPDTPAAGIPQFGSWTQEHLAGALKSAPDTPVDRLVGAKEWDDNRSLLSGPNGQPLTARELAAKMQGGGAPAAPAPVQAGTQPAPAPSQSGTDGLPSQPYQVAGTGAKIPVPLGPPPVMPKADAPAGNRTARAQAIQVAKHAIGVLAASGWMGEAGKGVAEAAKARLDMARRWLDPTDFDRIAISSGLTPGSPEYQALARSNIDKRPDQIKIAETAYPGQPSRVQEALRNSIDDKRPEAVRLGQAHQDTPGLVDDGLKVMARQKQMEASATTAGTKTAEAQQTAPAALDRAQQALATVAKLRNHPGRYWNTGLPGMLRSIPGTSGSDFVALFDQAKSQAFTQAFDMLRGAGAITDVEGTKGTSALNRLDRGLSDAGFDEALKDYEDVIRTGMARLQKATGAQPTRTGGTVTTPFGTIRRVR